MVQVRRLLYISFAAVLGLGLAGCASPSAEDVSDAEAGVPDIISPTENEAESWAGPTDGVWLRGDYALGQAIRGHELPAGSISSDYEITVTGVPSMTTTDGGKTVTMTSPLSVTRFQDLGYGQNFSESERIFFESGQRPTSEQYNESWGTYTNIVCGLPSISVGESTTCTVSFTTVPEAIVDSYWNINGSLAAAWPSQTPSQ